MVSRAIYQLRNNEQHIKVLQNVHTHHGVCDPSTCITACHNAFLSWDSLPYTTASLAALSFDSLLADSSSNDVDRLLAAPLLFQYFKNDVLMLVFSVLLMYACVCGVRVLVLDCGVLGCFVDDDKNGGNVFCIRDENIPLPFTPSLSFSFSFSFLSCFHNINNNNDQCYFCVKGCISIWMVLIVYLCAFFMQI